MSEDRKINFDQFKKALRLNEVSRIQDILSAITQAYGKCACAAKHDVRTVNGFVYARNMILC